ncbi:phosphatase PAP2 family protein [Kribbella jejuensis]|uniref:phosphatase PAP2 family protein n=1 Tax=Kribbella jejuensis TaxID=236068 RepID=UPI00163AA859|nr:phosphatase PAP2 family protein [Kribbella jejuensis]
MSQLSRWTLVGVLATVVGTIAFILQADAAVEGDGLAAFDPQLTQAFFDHRSAALSKVAQAVTFFGEIPVLTAATVIVAVLLRIVTRRWRPTAVLAAGMAGSAILTSVLKLVIGRHRPDSSFMLGAIINGFSFPSGHTLSGTCFFLLLAGLLWRSHAARGLKIGGTVIAVVLSIAMGLSRVYLGYHWATDVVAGWTMALTWLCLLATAIHLIGRRRDNGLNPRPVDRDDIRDRGGSIP